MQLTDGIKDSEEEPVNFLCEKPLILFFLCVVVNSRDRIPAPRISLAQMNMHGMFLLNVSVTKCITVTEFPNEMFLLAWCSSACLAMPLLGRSTAGIDRSAVDTSGRPSYIDQITRFPKWPVSQTSLPLDVQPAEAKLNRPSTALVLSHAFESIS
ncbi:hypothetical protein C5167_050550 [Papaver somniferum]|uniref:Uncharacterized protein n=1 Tax=Papaver somniferum TaxID=3469 RepID=A0A4Y7KSH1_PAPSO|nr:hypothetical protein C5167_050550 [Papaver somniferum]